MFARNRMRSWAGLALVAVLLPVGWAPCEAAPDPGPPSLRLWRVAGAGVRGGDATRAEARAASFDPLSPSSLPPEIAVSERDSAEYSPAIAYNPVRDQYLVVWENDWGGGYHDVYAQRIAGDGRLLSWFALSSGKSQANPDVAYDPVNDRYLVVWAHDRHGNGADWDLHGRFIPWNGPDPGLPEFAICDWNSNQGHPAVAYGRTQEEFLVVWKSDSPGVPGYISGRRVSATGGFPPGNGFTISSGAQIRDFPDVTYNLARNEWLVTWDLELSARNIDIWGIRLRGDGVPLTGGSPTVTGEFPIAGWPDFEAAPAVAACAAADQYLVAWQSDQGTGGSDYAIYARYLNGDAVPGAVLLVDDTTSPELNVDVGCNFAGNEYLVAWQTRYASPVKYGIWARRVRPGAGQGPAFPVRQPGSATDREYPALAAGRGGSLIAWEHQRDANANRDIHAQLLQHRVRLPGVLR